MEHSGTERRVDIQERRRAAEAFRLMQGEVRHLRCENALLGLRIAGPTARTLDRYAAKIEAMKDRAYLRQERKWRWRRFRAVSKLRDYEVALWVGGTMAACWGLFYWLALR